MSEELASLRQKLKVVEFYINEYNLVLKFLRHYLIKDICELQIKEFNRD